MYKTFSREPSNMSVSSRKAGARSVGSGSDNAPGRTFTSLEVCGQSIGNEMNVCCDQLSQSLGQCQDIVKTLQTLGRNVKTTKDEKQMFSSVKEAYNTIAELQKLLDSGKTDVSQLRFTIDSQTGNLKSPVRAGVKIENTEAYKARYVCDLDVSMATDAVDTYHVYGTMPLADGRILLTDFWNKRLKVFDSSNKLITHLDLPGRPWGLCPVSEREYAVTLTDTQTIVIVSVDLDKKILRITRKINVKEACRGITFHNDQLYVACGGFSGESKGHIRILTTAGKLNRLLEKNTSGNVLFARPRQIALSEDKTNMFITDADDVKVLDLISGVVIASIQKTCVKSPFGICNDGKGSMLVCGFVSHNIQKMVGVISETGQITSPVSLCLSPKTSMLMVGMERCKMLKLFDIGLK